MGAEGDGARLIDIVEQHSIAATILAAGLVESVRGTLRHPLPEAFRIRFVDHSTLGEQLTADLHHLATTPALIGVDGPPLAAWLDHAAHLAGLRPESATLRRYARIVRARAAPPATPPPALTVRAERRDGTIATGHGVAIASDRVLTAAALAFERDGIPRDDCRVIAPDGTSHPAVADPAAADLGAGWAALLLDPPLTVAPAPLAPRAPAADAIAHVGPHPACVADPDAELGYGARAVRLVLARAPRAPLIGAPVMVDGHVIGVIVQDATDDSAIYASGAVDPDRALGRAEALRDDLRDDLPAAPGPLGKAVQLDRTRQWDRLVQLCQRDASGLIVFHGEASQAQYRFVERMTRDLAGQLDGEAPHIVLAPYGRSNYGRAPTSAADWIANVPRLLANGGRDTDDAIHRAREHRRLVLVFDAPLDAEPDIGAALIRDLVEIEAPDLFARAGGRHPLHLMLAVSYAAPPVDLIEWLVCHAHAPRGRRWDLEVLPQTTFPGWTDDVLPFLLREGFTHVERARIKRAYHDIAADTRSYDALARAVQHILDARDQRPAP